MAPAAQQFELVRSILCRLASNLNTICVGEDEVRWADQKATLTSLRDELATEERHRQLVVQALQRMYEQHEKSQHKLKRRGQGGKLRRLSQKMLDLHRQICECDNQVTTMLVLFYDQYYR